MIRVDGRSDSPSLIRVRGLYLRHLLLSPPQPTLPAGSDKALPDNRARSSWCFLVVAGYSPAGTFNRRRAAVSFVSLWDASISGLLTWLR